MAASRPVQPLLNNDEECNNIKAQITTQLDILVTRATNKSSELTRLREEVAALECENKSLQAKFDQATKQNQGLTIKVTRLQERAESEANLRRQIDADHIELKERFERLTKERQTDSLGSAGANPKKRLRASSPEPLPVSGRQVPVQQQSLQPRGIAVASGSRAPNTPVLGSTDSDAGVGKSFTRKAIGFALGGSHSEAIVLKIGSKNSIGVEQLAAFKLESHNLAPRKPKQGGVFFIGHREQKIIGTPENGNNIFELFIGRQPNDWIYMGTYELQRIDPMTREDWLNKCDEQFRSSYLITYFYRHDEEVAKRYRNTLNISELRKLYDSGEVRVPQVRANYIGFNPNLQDTVQREMEKLKRS